VLTLVDSEASMTNVSHMAEKAGWQVQVAQSGNEFRLELTRRAEAALAATQAVGKAEVLDRPLVLVVSADVMGRGEAELGGILIRSFFHALGEAETRPQTLVFYNTGVKLACEGSLILADLRALQDEGIDMLVCGTCLGYLDIKEKLAVGHVSNMYTIAETVLNAGKVVYL